MRAVYQIPDKISDKKNSPRHPFSVFRCLSAGPIALSRFNFVINGPRVLVLKGIKKRLADNEDETGP